jgi:hypothetical protein
MEFSYWFIFQLIFRRFTHEFAGFRVNLTRYPEVAKALATKDFNAFAVAAMAIFLEGLVEVAEGALIEGMAGNGQWSLVIHR